MPIRQVCVFALTLAAVLVGPTNVVAQLTLESEWAGGALGTWYNPINPVQLEIDVDLSPDWDIDGTIEIGGVTFGAINYPSNLPGFSVESQCTTRAQ